MSASLQRKLAAETQGTPLGTDVAQWEQDLAASQSQNSSTVTGYLQTLISDAAADRHLDDGIALARRIGRPYLEVTGLAHLAQLLSWRSFQLGAQRSLQAIELARQHGWADEPVAGIAYLALGVAMVAQGRIEDAERALGQAERTVRAEAEPAAGMRLSYGRGMLEFVSGRHDAALRAFRAAERLANSVVTPHTLAPRLRSHLLQTLVRTGDKRRVEQALAGLDGPERDRGETRIAEAARPG